MAATLTEEVAQELPSVLITKSKADPVAERRRAKVRFCLRPPSSTAASMGAGRVEAHVGLTCVDVPVSVRWAQAMKVLDAKLAAMAKEVGSPWGDEESAVSGGARGP